MIFFEIAFGALITAGAFCIVPLAVADLCKSPMSKKKYMIICIVGESAIAIAFKVYRSFSGADFGTFYPAILWSTIFYNVGLSILRKRKMLSGTTAPQQPPEPAVVTPAPDAEPVPAPDVSPAPSPAPSSAPAKPTPPPPITETWYTCPSCGCLSPTGKICACGYHPPKAAAASPARRKWPIIAIAVLAVALAFSLFYNVEQQSKISQKEADLQRLQAYGDDCREKIADLYEYNNYLVDDMRFYNPDVPTDFSSTKNRYANRTQLHSPYLQYLINNQNK